MIAPVVATEWKNFSRDRAAVALAVVLPIVFFSVFSVVFSGAINAESRRIRLGIVDLDGSEVSRKFIGALAAEPAIELHRAPRAGAAVFDVEEVQKGVRGGEFPVALIVPKGFGSAVFDFNASRRPQLQLLTDGSDPVATGLATGMIQKVLATAMPDESAQAGMQLFRVWSGGLTPRQEANLQSNLAANRELRDSSGSGSQSGLATLTVRDILGERKENPVVAFYAAAMGVMFLLFSAARSGGSLLDEVDSGTLDRVLSTRVSMTSLLLGKLFFLTLLGFIQLWIMFLWGAVAFDLELAPHLGGIFVMSLATSLAASAFGILLASACRTRAQLYAVSTLVILIISAVGGSMFPRFLMPESVLRYSLLLFNSWALEGFLKIFWREAPASAVWPETVVLLTWSGVFFIAARVLARRWERT
jgi:ABC-2 type transport system permease protein